MSHPVKSVCVYCGSRPGEDPAYIKEAETLGQLIAKCDFDLVYGAGSIGLMGIVARSAIDAGANVIGIIPEHLDAVEIIQSGLSETHITNNMHERKMLMFDRSDAFIIMPGGLGTLDETFEIVTWAQLNLHHKPIVLVNVNGYWDQLISLLENMVKQGFASPQHQHIIKVVDDASQAMGFLCEQSLIEEESRSSLF